VNEQPAPLDLTIAETALERGDYGQCLEQLTPLAEARPLPDPEGARVRLLMVTALMGQGRDQEALTICQLLSRSSEPQLRQQARQLLTILEAPALDRPERWSMRLPPLSIQASGDAAPVSSRRRRSRKPPPPPTGPTRPPALGFAVLVAAVLLALTVVLSGCVRMQADLSSPAPDRLQLAWEIQSSTDQLLPWQQRFDRTLQTLRPDVTVEHPRPGAQRITTAAMSSAAFRSTLTQVFQLLSASAGIDLPEPRIRLVERNWLVGVQQRLILQLDLDRLPDLPGVDLALGLNQGQVNQTLRPAENINLEASSWRWSPLGLGSLVVAVLLLLSLLLQGVRRRLGFGFPELPS
jgi:hypothetical protein